MVDLYGGKSSVMHVLISALQLCVTKERLRRDPASGVRDCHQVRQISFPESSPLRVHIRAKVSRVLVSPISNSRSTPQTDLIKKSNSRCINGICSTGTEVCFSLNPKPGFLGTKKPGQPARISRQKKAPSEDEA